VKHSHFKESECPANICLVSEERSASIFRVESSRQRECSCDTSINIHICDIPEDDNLSTIVCVISELSQHLNNTFLWDVRGPRGSVVG
jgi:hypothetical protein